VPALAELGLPAVVIGGPGHVGRLSNVWSDDAAALVETVEYLYALGHRRIARVGGMAPFLHTRIRSEAFQAASTRLKLTQAVSEVSDYSGEDGARITRRLLSGARRPTAIVYDNDVMAIAGLGVAQEMGLSVPGDVSIVGWDDSALCRLVHPPLTALQRDIPAYGARAAGLLLDLIDGKPAESVQTDTARLAPRGSTAAPPARARV
jgi:DNA-binding LacI/PurR family transcriptional regulator